ncbi:hypothetical protein M0G74_04145 [Microbulbifer sp. CAU 1566]|uniref:hypothetical protein n=1 Tax=Microbulbifer sp. CAU 1566 TaxID=2933269 RepID=UPI002005CA6A|nr:hypothetical protein [Microbulbifer sp. CAU 1566]MCK7596460.1 hypothetical protein [Microbulbifer sp. CAU 1566]
MTDYVIFDHHLRFLRRWQEIFTALFAFSAALSLIPLLNPELEPLDTRTAYILSLSFCSLLGPAAVYAYYQRQRAPYRALAIDEEGIWYQYRGREQGLIPWGAIASQQENTFLQYLYLSDADGKLLLSASFHLQDFEDLREIIAHQIALHSRGAVACRFGRSSSYHMAYALGPLFLLIMGIYVAQVSNPWLGYGAMSFTIITVLHEYIITACGVCILHNAVEVRYPFGKKRIAFADIERLRINDNIAYGNRYPELWITTSGINKPLKLKKLGIDPSALYARLKKAMANHSAEASH